MLRADGCLVTPGLINTHHHIYQNLTRSYRPAVNGTLFQWLTTLYPLWAGSTRRPPTCRRGSAWPSWPSAGAPRRPTTSTSTRAGGGDLIAAEITGRPRARHALPPDPRLDEPVGEGRRPAARLGGAGRRRDPRRQRAAGRGLHHDPSWGAMVRIALAPVLAVLGHARADAARPPSWPSGSTSASTPTWPRTPTRTRYAAERFGKRHHRALRGRRLEERPLLGGPLHLPRRRRRSAGSVRLGYGRGPLPELEHDDRRRRHRPGGRPPGRRRARRARLRRLGVDRLAPRCGWRPATPCCSAACGAGPRRPAPATRSRSAPVGRPPASAATGELGVLAVGAAGDLVCWPLEGIPFAGALVRPRRGLAALRPGGGPPHRGRRPGRRRATASSPPPGSRTSSAVTGSPADASRPTDPRSPGRGTWDVRDRCGRRPGRGRRPPACAPSGSRCGPG